MRGCPCQVQVYSWERHLATLQLPSDPTCLVVEDTRVYIGCRTGKVYRVCLSSLQKRPRKGPRSPNIVLVGEEDMWLVHRGIRLLASCSVGLVASGDIEPTALYSTTDKCSRLQQLSALDEDGDGASITCLRCLEVTSPEALVPWARAFGQQAALLRAPVVIAGKRNGDVSWSSLSPGDMQVQQGGTWRSARGKAGGVVAVIDATAYGAVLVALQESGEAFVIKGHHKSQEPPVALQLCSTQVQSASLMTGSSSFACLCDGRVIVAR